MYRGSSTRAGGKEPGPEGFITFGMNPVGLGPNSKKMVAALSKLKWLVVVENVETETAPLLEGAEGIRAGPPPSQIQTEVFLLPAANFAEKDGTFTNSARWLQWKWKALDPPGQAKADQEILARDLPRGARPLPEGRRRAARAGPERLLVLHEPGEPGPRRGAEGDERQGARRHPRPQGQDEDPQDGGPAARRLRRSSRTTARRCAATGCTRASTPRPGNNAQRRNNADPTGLGMYPRLGVLVAGEPPRHVQPRLRRRRGQAVGSDARRASRGTARSGSATCPT